MRSYLIIPFLYRLRSLHMFPLFQFPEGCHPNINDPSTFETNYTISETEIEAALNYSISNDTKEEEVIPFIHTSWEDMMRFGIGEA